MENAGTSINSYLSILDDGKSDISFLQVLESQNDNELSPKIFRKKKYDKAKLQRGRPAQSIQKKVEDPVETPKSRSGIIVIRLPN